MRAANRDAPRVDVAAEAAEVSAEEIAAWVEGLRTPPRPPDPPPSPRPSRATRRWRWARPVRRAVLGLLAAIIVLTSRDAASQATGSTTWLSRPDPLTGAVLTSEPANAPVVSADGLVVAFSSSSANLVAGQPDVNAAPDVFVYDRTRPPEVAVELISVGLDGRPPARGTSSQPSLSATGRFVAFTTEAALDPADGDDDPDVYVRDRAEGSTELVSGAIPVGPFDFAVNSPAISADGRYVAMVAGQLQALTREGPGQVYRYDRLDRVYTLVSHASRRAQVGGDGNSTSPAISADGNAVAFLSEADNLDASAPSTFPRVYVWLSDRTAVVLASRARQGEVADGACGPPAISSEGNRVAFACQAGNLASDDINPGGDVFGFNVRGTAPPFLVSVGRAEAPTATACLGGTAPGSCPARVAISGDGRWVAFASTADNLLTPEDGPDTNERPDVFVRDLERNRTTRASLTAAGGQIGNGDSSSPSISGEGRYVAFVSSSPTLGDADCRGQACPDDVFLRDRSERESSTPTSAPPAAERARVVVQPVIVRGGRVTSVVGANFAPGSQVEITFETAFQPVRVTADRAGGFTAPLIVPHGGRFGPQILTARSGARVATTSFLVVPRGLQPPAAAFNT